MEIFGALCLVGVLSVMVEMYGEAVSLPNYIAPSASVGQMKSAVEGLLTRLLPGRAEEFRVEILPRNGSDYFKVVAAGLEGGNVQVVASTGVTAAQGVLHYLKYSCNCSVSWDGDQLDLPEVLPAVEVEIQVVDRLRYAHNPCFFSYSAAFWQWPRWEREIDHLALLGVNVAFSPTGQEALWRAVYLSLGLTQAELDHYFAGYAFLAWGRMGNLQAWGGPLTPAWHQRTLALQHKIIARMRSFGMLTVLPAFSGHVPAGLLRLFPDANVTKLSAWGHFTEPYTKTYFMSPHDPLFERIGTAIITEVTSQLGSDHLYLCDPYNEMTPASSDLSYLAGVSKAIFKVLMKADPKAVWVAQGWMFFNKIDFWDRPQAEAFLTSVPLGRMLLLDLAAEVVPQFIRLESFFGQPYIFCLLNNYGGVQGLFGNVEVLLKNLHQARTQPSSSLVGLGMSPEGIYNNYVMIDLMSEMSWRITSPSLPVWVANFTSRRYGVVDARLTQAWELLLGSVYNCSQPIRYHGKYVTIMHRPKLHPVTRVWYSLSSLIKAWDLLIGVAQQPVTTQIIQPEEFHHEHQQRDSRPRKRTVSQSVTGSIRMEEASGESEGNIVTQKVTFLHDVVDVSRQVLQEVGGEMVTILLENYHNQVLLAVQQSNKILQDLLQDLDTLLGTSPSFLLGRWVQDASLTASSPEEKERILYNALNQITLWGPDGEILDYAVKQWSGMIRDYVMPRWDMFGTMLASALRSGKGFDKKEFNRRVFEGVEKPFGEQKNMSYTPWPLGDTISTALHLHGKYRPFFSHRVLKHRQLKLQRAQATERKEIQKEDKDRISITNLRIFM